jgi:N-hydroxyarylamine O-acetyltransferase
MNLMNQGVHIIRNGAAEAAHLADRKALHLLVAQHFGFDLPELETMRVDGVPDWQ